ncbi:hypothetical protein [Methylobacterium iners]|uniref:Uncharacterized protein n=1 Tax=Methylobacterium iners TaxID=418707 RepID=A0ABQ4S3R5_9HYPH|nr:hypothetical protein [Methylobacterium iners]GJD97734.1 hypothetical protein OCOJLMKI_4967 [Methylobacterium iners]
MNDNPVTAETKPWFMSKTIIGTAITGVAIVGGFFGVDLDEETKKLVVDQTEALVVAGAALGGTVITVYGRFAAKKGLSLK